MTSEPESASAARYGLSEQGMLRALEENGGGAVLDQFARLIGRDRRVLPGQANAWLKLVAKGAVAGEHDKIILTAAGRAAIA